MYHPSPKAVEMGQSRFYFILSLNYDHLTTVLEHIDELVSTYDRGACSASECCEYIDVVYNEIVFVLANAADMYVPVRRKNFYKFWWDEELNLLKEASVDANKLWIASGKPRHGPVYY